MKRPENNLYGTFDRPSEETEASPFASRSATGCKVGATGKNKGISHK
jgi:hypothetical protein